MWKSGGDLGMYKKGKSGDRNIQKAYESGVSLVTIDE